MLKLNLIVTLTMLVRQDKMKVDILNPDCHTHTHGLVAYSDPVTHYQQSTLGSTFNSMGQTFEINSNWCTLTCVRQGNQTIPQCPSVYF